jgi:hypothetical protein
VAHEYRRNSMTDHFETYTTTLGYPIDSLDQDMDRSPLVRVVESLREHEPRIVANWAVRISTLPAFRATPEIQLGELESRIPELLSAVLSVITVADVAVDALPLERAQGIAIEHGRSRCRSGFSIGELIAGLQMLRQEVWTSAWRSGDPGSLRRGSYREFETRLNAAFDSIIVAAAEAWVVEGRLVLHEAASESGVTQG